MKSKKIKSDEARIENINLHYVIKDMARGFIHGVHRIFENRMSNYPQQLELSESLLLWEAMSHLAKDEEIGQAELTRHIRNLVCCFAENEYRQEVTTFMAYYKIELARQREIALGRHLINKQEEYTLPFFEVKNSKVGSFIVKQTVNNFARAGSFVLRKQIKDFPKGLTGPEAKAVYTSINKMLEHKEIKNKKTLTQIRDIVCSLIDCQDFYRKKFLVVVRYMEAKWATREKP